MAQGRRPAKLGQRNKSEHAMQPWQPQYQQQENQMQPAQYQQPQQQQMQQQQQQQGQPQFVMANGAVRQSRIKDRPVPQETRDSSLKVKIELDLEAEVDLYARVKGDVTIGLM